MFRFALQQTDALKLAFLFILEEAEPQFHIEGIEIRVDTGGRLDAQFHPQFDIDQEIELIQPPVAEPAKAAITGYDSLSFYRFTYNFCYLPINKPFIQFLDDVALIMLYQVVIHVLDFRNHNKFS